MVDDRDCLTSEDAQLEPTLETKHVPAFMTEQELKAMIPTSRLTPREFIRLGSVSSGPNPPSHQHQPQPPSQPPHANRQSFKYTHPQPQSGNGISRSGPQAPSGYAGRTPGGAAAGSGPAYGARSGANSLFPRRNDAADETEAGDDHENEPKTTKNADFKTAHERLVCFL